MQQLNVKGSFIEKTTQDVFKIVAKKTTGLQEIIN